MCKSRLKKLYKKYFSKTQKESMKQYIIYRIKSKDSLYRCRVERLTKFITWSLVLLVLTTGHFLALNGYLVAMLSTTIWFLTPDVTAYILECIYKVHHNKNTYR